jgi:peptide/nickel transport system ATP-binding protein
MLSKENENATNSIILKVKDLKVEYLTTPVINAINKISIDIYRNEILGIVGESGCGKSTLAYSLLNMIPPPGRITGGKIIYYGYNPPKDILSLSKDELRRYRWREVSLVSQAAQSCLNPVMNIYEHFIETGITHHMKSKRKIIEKVKQLLTYVRLDESILERYPHELSGGMKQRVIIALSLLLDPKIVILDEPTSALDLITQKFILEMLKDLKKNLNLSMIFITHDISILADISTRITVMYAGKIVEIANTDEIFYNPKHPYTIGLLNAIPSIVSDINKVRSIPGFVLSLASLPLGCVFADRCQYVDNICKEIAPELIDIGDNHYVACHRYI